MRALDIFLNIRICTYQKYCSPLLF